MYSIMTTAIYAFAFFILCTHLRPVEALSPNDKKGKISPSAVWIAAFFALLIRLLAAPYTSAHPTDMRCWTFWGSRLASVSPTGFYSDKVFADYPPGYMYILWPIGCIVKTLTPSNHIILLLYKLPGILGDIGFSLVLYHIIKKQKNEKLALVIFALTAFNPLIYFNSVMWGQMDSLLLLCTLLSLYDLYEEKYIKAAVFFALAALLKPQALMLSPIYLYAYISTKDIKTVLKGFFTGILIVIALSVPFSPAWQNGGNIFLRILKSLNPIWLTEKYFGALSSYNYASINAFNIPALLGGNWKEISSPMLFLPWRIWGYIMILASFIISGILFFKLQKRSAKIFVPAFFIIAFLYAFGTKMHERYICLAVSFLPILYVFSGKRTYLYLFAAMSTVNLFNLDYVFYCAANGNIAPKQIYIIPIALIQSGLIIYSLFTIYHNYFKKSTKNKENAPIFQKSGKIMRVDVVAISLITVIYSFAAFYNIGNGYAPQTYIKGNSASFTVELEKEAKIHSIAYYFGSTTSGAALNAEYSADGITYKKGEDFKFESVFKWELKKGDTKAKFIRLTPNTPDFTLYEIGFISPNGHTLPIKSVKDDSGKILSALYDEQTLIPKESNFKNGTYFDEVYHARSANELLYGAPYYETTHPPLGKILISVGISVFGMTPFGWRFMGTLFGIFMLPVFYIFLKKIFKRTRCAVLGTTLFAVDFMHYSLTKMATIDSFTVFFIILSWLLLYIFLSRLLEKSTHNDITAKFLYLPLLFCGISVGLGVSSKWTAVYSAFGLGVVFFAALYFAAKNFKAQKSSIKPLLMKLLPFCVLSFVIIPFCIYTASYIPVAKCQNDGVFAAMIKSQKYMFSYHSELSATHPYSSKWYSWPFVYRPLLAYYKDFGASSSSLTIMGSPLLYWGGVIAFAFCIYTLVKNRSKKLAFIFAALLSQFLPWIFVSRCTFIYHFFASVPFMIMLIIYAITVLENRHKNYKYLSLAFTVLCVISFILFFPVLSGIEVPKIYVIGVLKWFSNWVF